MRNNDDFEEGGYKEDRRRIGGEQEGQDEVSRSSS